MKKKSILMTGAVLLAFSAFVSCSKSAEAPVKEITTYTAKNGLSLKLNGRDIDDATVVYTPTLGNAEKASISVKRADFDLMTLAGFVTKAGENQGIPTHILPGVPELTINLDLNIDGDNATFEGEGTPQTCSFKYSGAVSKSALSLTISDVKVADSPMKGTWRLQQPDSDTTKAAGNTVYVSWKRKTDTKRLIPSIPIDVIFPMIPIIPVSVDGENMTLEQALAKVFGGFHFQDNGEVSVFYKSKATDLDFKESVGTFVSYVPMATGLMRAYPCFTEIAKAAEEAETKGAEPDPAAIMAYVFRFASNIANYGLGIGYKDNSGATTLYLDTDSMCAILQAVKEIYAIEGVKDSIDNLIRGKVVIPIPVLGDVELADILPGIIESIPENCRASIETAELGVNLIPGN